MLNNIEVIERIRKNLYNISANLHAESYISCKGKKKKIKSYTPSSEASEALEMLKLASKSNEWDTETEKKIKGFIMLKRNIDSNLLLDNEVYWSEVINKRKH